MAKERPDKIEEISTSKSKSIQNPYENTAGDVISGKKPETMEQRQATQSDSVNFSNTAQALQKLSELSKHPGINKILEEHFNLTVEQLNKLINENPALALKKIEEMLEAIKKGKLCPDSPRDLSKEQKVASDEPEI